MRLPTRRSTKILEADDPMMTGEKFSQLEQKLANFKKQRPALALEVSRLAELGDFSENVEYQLAKGRLRRTNEQILRLEYQLRHAVVINKLGNGVVGVGSSVLVEVNGEQKTFIILGSAESNPEKGIISRNSPLGKLLLEKKKGESIEVVLPRGKVVYTIIGIE